MLPPGDTTIIPLNCKLRLSPGYFELLNQQAKKEITGLVGVIDPDYQEEIRLDYGGEKKYV